MATMRKHLTAMAQNHNRDSFIFKDKNTPTATLHGTKEGVFPGLGQTHDLGQFHPNHVPEYHSILHGCREQNESYEVIEFLFLGAPVVRSPVMRNHNSKPSTTPRDVWKVVWSVGRV